MLFRSSYQKDGGRQPPGAYAEARFQSGVGGLLVAPEVARKQPSGDTDAADQVTECQLKKGQISSCPDPWDGDHGESRCLGRDDGKENGPGWKIARAEEVVRRAPLMSSDPEPDAQGEGEIQDDDDEVWLAQR